MRNIVLIDTLREIKKTKSRFISIAVIIAIGTGFYGGIKNTSADMKLTADTYYEDTNLADFHIQGTMGITEDDVKAVEGLDGVKKAQGGYSLDVYVETDANNAIIRLLSYPTDGRAKEADYINQPTLIEGRLPNRKNECAVESSLSTPANFYIGNTLNFISGTDDPLSDALSADYCNVVGVISSSNYNSYDRGTTQIGDGQLTNYIYLAEDNFTYEVYTDLYVSLEDSFTYSSFTDKYKEMIDEYQTTLEEFGEDRSLVRYEEVMDEAREKIADARDELADGEAEAEEELNDAATKIADAEEELADGEKTQAKEVAKARKKLADAKSDLANGQVDYDEAYADYLKEIEDARKEIADGWEELAKAEEEVADGWQQYYDGLAKYQYGSKNGGSELSEASSQVSSLKVIKSKVDSVYNSLQNGGSITSNLADIMYINAALSELGVVYSIPTEDTAANTNVAKNILNVVSTELGTQIASAEAQIDAGYDKLDSSLDKAKKKLAQAYDDLVAAEEEIEENKQKLIDAEEELEQSIIDAEAEFADARNELADGKKEISDAEKTLNKEIVKSNEEINDGKAKIEDAKKEYEDAVIETNQKIADAKEELDKAEADLADLEVPEWYVFDRTSYPGYGDYGTDAERIDHVVAVFPIFFILIAILICFTTMTRMVEEHRTQIGTFKALGYSNGTIMAKYLTYALSASVVGSLIGMSIGFKLFPNIIFNAYKTMYVYPDLICPYNVPVMIVATLVAIASTTVAAYAACRAELVAEPSQLMRPKAPKAGKTTLLEHWRWFWNKLSFSRKVTIRNISRYKSRISLMVIGVAGCTALMVAGFGLQHSISGIVNMQFNEIFKYQLVGAIEENLDESEWRDVIRTVDSCDVLEDYSFVYRSTAEEVIDGTKRTAYIFVPDNVENISDFVTFRVRTTKEPLTLDDSGAIINEKFAKMLGVEVGDVITISDKDIAGEVRIAGITENYAENYIYMTPNYYREVYGTDIEHNILLGNFIENTEENRSKAGNELMENDHIIGISYITDIGDKFSDLMDSLNIIVIVLIVCAGLLAFVVLYNLTNINITERIRELATIKLLGFYDIEVSAYIYRENVISSFIGISLGLWLGVYLHMFIVHTAEVDAVMFDPTRGALSYVASALLACVFTFAVNFLLHFKLKKIDMVESLKSVE